MGQFRTGTYSSSLEHPWAPRPAPRVKGLSKTSGSRSLSQKVGGLVLDIDILKEAQKGRPFGRETSGYGYRQLWALLRL